MDRIQEEKDKILKVNPVTLELEKMEFPESQLGVVSTVVGDYISICGIELPVKRTATKK